MVTKEVKNSSIERKSFGKEVFYKNPDESIRNEYLNKESSRKEKLEKYLKASTEAKSFIGWLNFIIKSTILNKDIETEFILKICKEKHNQFKKIEEIKILAWKGKSGLKLFEYPDRFICINYRKEEKDGEVKEIKTEIEKKDLNELIAVLNLFKEKEKIPTSEIAEKLYKKDWTFIFSDRPLHIKLTFMFNILEQKGYIKYFRSGKITLLRNLENTKW